MLCVLACACVRAVGLFLLPIAIIYVLKRVDGGGLSVVPAAEFWRQFLRSKFATADETEQFGSDIATGAIRKPPQIQQIQQQSPLPSQAQRHTQPQKAPSFGIKRMMLKNFGIDLYSASWSPQQQQQRRRQQQWEGREHGTTTPMMPMMPMKKADATEANSGTSTTNNTSSVGCKLDGPGTGTHYHFYIPHLAHTSHKCTLGYHLFHGH